MICESCNFESTEETVEIENNDGIVLYTTHCPKCIVLEKKLIDKEIDFKMIDDTSKVIAFGSSVGILSAPILVVDGDVKDFSNAIKWINSL